MKYLPQHSELSKHIDHYWVIDSAEEVFQSSRIVYDYPGIRPEIILMLKGKLQYRYLGINGETNKHLLASHIEAEFLFDAERLDRFIVIQFKPRSLSALLPFMDISPTALIRKSVCDAEEVFGDSINKLVSHLREVPNESMAQLLDEWFLARMDQVNVGFVTELFNEVERADGTSFKTSRSLQAMKDITRYSYSTLERYFKKETGLTPKKYQTLGRYKAAVEEIYDTQNTNWNYYVNKYGYFDQSHFIKEVKRYANFTPTQLLETPGLRTFRPD